MIQGGSRIASRSSCTVPLSLGWVARLDVDSGTRMSVCALVTDKRQGIDERGAIARREPLGDTTD